MIKYVKGDLLNAEQNIIVHQVNCQGVMGSGVAKAIRAKYPEAYRRYFQMYRASFDSRFSDPLLGQAQLITIDDKTIVNLFGQDNYLPRGITHTSYDALVIGFNEIKSSTKEDLAMPKIGCGLGGGDWKIVSAIIESVFDDRDVYIYELE